jgi:hypothetical protein
VSAAAADFDEPSGAMASTITSLAFLQAPSVVSEPRKSSAQSLGKLKLTIGFRMVFAPPKTSRRTTSTHDFTAECLGQPGYAPLACDLPSLLVRSRCTSDPTHAPGHVVTKGSS